MLANLGAHTVEVRTPADLDGCDGLILPGGESTTQLQFLQEEGLDAAIRKFASDDKAIYGRQVHSDVVTGKTTLHKEPLEMVFIRGPIIERIGKDVEVLAEYAGKPALVQKGNVMASAFHPELTSDTTVHERFLQTAALRGQREQHRSDARNGQRNGRKKLKRARLTALEKS
jgi:5'-phosphate synthase pdxT subunit